MAHTLEEVIRQIGTGDLTDGTILVNVDTNERVIVQEGSLHFLTLNDYVSNTVPLVSGMISSKWEAVPTVDGLESITIDEAITKLVYGENVTIKRPGASPGNDLHTFETLGELLDYIESLEHMNDVQVALSQEFYLLPVDTKKKYGRKTTETEAWGMLLDNKMFGFSAQKIAYKYDISLRNAYYILNGTYYPTVYEKFNTMLREGEL